MLASTAKLRNEILKGSRSALSRGITLVESSRPDHRLEAQALVSSLLSMPKTPRATASGLRNTLRIGLTGAPGVGKSSFIEAFGLYLLQRGHKLAVLAVDPSSTRTGGSILGDKTRMPGLSVHPRAYVRPSPSRYPSSFGLQYQSETMVSDMVDMFILLVSPGGGDELQGIKKGIVECADAILVNKSDGEMETQAKIVEVFHSISAENR
ncbi:MAG: hypothetical protein SGCHY_004899 [Lobulomycetales sp.]